MKCGGDLVTSKRILAVNVNDLKRLVDEGLSLECAGLAALSPVAALRDLVPINQQAARSRRWPKRRQGGALQGIGSSASGMEGFEFFLIGRHLNQLRDDPRQHFQRTIDFRFSVIAAQGESD